MSINQLAQQVTQTDIQFMQMALTMAQQAASLGEVPVGAVIVDQNDQVISQAYNRTIMDCDPSAHAEIIALRLAAKNLANYRLNNLRIYVSLEPCLMCLGAIFHARIAEIIYAATDPKTGACGGFADLANVPGLNHHASIRGGVLAEDSANLLRDFFRQRR